VPRAVAKWSGKLVVENGGFCGVGSPKMGLDLSEYDGLCLRVRGGGETYKVNVKTTDQVRR
jgi:Complex I intermediate-associated protein 30 (CIA30)